MFKIFHFLIVSFFILLSFVFDVYKARSLQLVSFFSISSFSFKSKPINILRKCQKFTLKHKQSRIFYLKDLFCTISPNNKFITCLKTHFVAWQKWFIACLKMFLTYIKISFQLRWRNHYFNVLLFIETYCLIVYV